MKERNDYIRREDLIDKIKNGYYFQSDRIIATINSIHSADVRENVRGKWVKKESPSMIWCECSICHYRPRNNDLSYFCPYCGADMRQKTEQSLNNKIKIAEDFFGMLFDAANANQKESEEKQHESNA